MTKRKTPAKADSKSLVSEYDPLLSGMVEVLEQARRAAARSVNSVMTAAYWEIGRRIVEFEQGGERRAEYGVELIKKLSKDLTAKLGRGFSRRNLEQMRLFYFDRRIAQTVSAQSGEVNLHQRFPLPWSHYVQLMSVEKAEARKFYEAEALRGGWSVRQLSRQISTLFYERTLRSRNKVAMLSKGGIPLPEEVPTPEEEIKDPFVLEFLGLKDEYSCFYRFLCFWSPGNRRPTGGVSVAQA